MSAVSFSANEYVSPHIPLPRSLAAGPGHGRERARAVFNEVADLYDRARPGYPPAMFDDLLAGVAVREGTRVVEVGCGTGQATRVLASTGAHIRAIELGPDLATTARRNLSRFANVTVEVGSFETAQLASASADVLFSATAFHWINPAFGFPKAADILAADGHLVLATNAHVAGGTQESIAADVQQLHRRVAPDVGAWVFASAADVTRRALAGGDIAGVWSRIDRCFLEPPKVAQLFADPFVATYRWTQFYDRDLYLDMLATQSTYALLEPARRTELLAGIGDLIDEHLGGTISKAYLTVLAIAQKRRRATPAG